MKFIRLLLDPLSYLNTFFGIKVHFNIPVHAVFDDFFIICISAFQNRWHETKSFETDFVLFYTSPKCSNNE